jgi:hypothetical protein
LRKANGVATQAAFGEAYDIGNQAAVGFFLNGQTALSLKAARGFALGLGVQIDAFSPRLAEMAAEYGRLAKTPEASAKDLRELMKRSRTGEAPRVRIVKAPKGTPSRRRTGSDK